MLPLRFPMNEADDLGLQTHHGQKGIVGQHHILGKNQVSATAKIRTEARGRWHLRGNECKWSLHSGHETRDAMSGTWDAATYRKRAQKWREDAQAMPPGKERDACTVLADGYANLVALIEDANNNYRGPTPSD